MRSIRKKLRKFHINKMDKSDNSALENGTILKIVILDSLPQNGMEPRTTHEKRGMFQHISLNKASVLQNATEVGMPSFRSSKYTLS